MKRIVYAIAIAFSALVGTAQQTSVINHYLVNPFFINPAAAGLNGSNAFLDYNKQWQGFQGAPETQVLTIDGTIKRDKIGLGFTLINDQSNILGSTAGLLSYAYKIDLAKTQKLRFGISAGFVQNRVLFDNIIAEDDSEAQIFINNQNATNVDVNGGMLYSLSNFSVGLAVNHLMPNQFQYENNYTSNSLTFSNIRHFLVHAQYNFHLKGGKWLVKPNFLMKGVQGIPFLLEGGVTGEYKKQVWLTARYKHKVGYNVAAGGVIAKQLILAYSYGISSNHISTQNSGTHEILLGYKFMKNTKSGDGASSKDLNKLHEQNAELYEKVDYLNKENEQIREELEQQKKLLKEKVFGLDELNAEFEREQEAREEIVKENEFDIDKDLDANNAEIKTIEDGQLYIIVGATRSAEQAKKFQKVVFREYKLMTKIIRNNNDTWYFVYSLQTQDINAARKELDRVRKMNNKNIFVGKPWMYKH